MQILYYTAITEINHLVGLRKLLQALNMFFLFYGKMATFERSILLSKSYSTEHWLGVISNQLDSRLALGMILNFSRFQFTYL